MTRVLGLSHRTALLNDNLGPQNHAALGARGLIPDAAVNGDGGDNTLNGTSGDDIIHGNGGNDVINITQGGNDSVFGDAGNDIVNAGATLTTADKINGGTGFNTLNISGNYNLDFNAAGTGGNAGLVNIQDIVLGAGHNYDLGFANDVVAAGGTLNVNGGALTSTHTMHLEYADETNGTYFIIGGAGSDIFDPGSGTSVFHLENGGEDIVNGAGPANLGGNVTYYMGGALDAGDRLDADSDSINTMFLDGDYTGAHAVLMNGNTIKEIQTMHFAAGHSYSLTLEYGNVGEDVLGGSMTVDGSLLGAANTLTFNAFNTLPNVSLFFHGGAGNDAFTGGAGGPGGNDTSYFYLDKGGNDTAIGNTGNDSFYMAAALNAGDSLNGGGGSDFVDLNGDYSAQVVMNANTIVDIDTIVLEGVHNYNFKFNDANVGAGQTMTVNGLTIGSGVLTVDASAETNGNYKVIGGAASDTISTGAGSDNIDLEQGGNDTLHAGAGADTIVLNAAFNVLDQIDGGTGTDAMYLNGDYSGFKAVLMNATTLTNVEQIYMAAGHNYALASNDATVVAGQQLYVDSTALTAANTLNFDGSAETDGSFFFAAGAGNDTLSGGAQADVFSLTAGGNDSISGGGGDDQFKFGTTFNANDRVDGNAGNDTVVLNGDYVFANALTMGATTMVNVETLLLTTGHNYTITTADATVAAGQTLTVSASTLGVGNALNFNGAAETDGKFVIASGAADDTLTGGAGSDTFTSGAGSDTLTGGAGADIFQFTTSNLTSGDTVNGGIDAAFDRLTFTTAGTAAATAFTNVSHIEQIVLTNGTNNIHLADSMVGSADDNHLITVFASSGTGADTIDASGVTSTVNKVTFSSGGGNDTLTGGAGADTFVFAFTELTSADNVNGGTGASLDTLSLSSAGTIASGIFAGVSHIEQIVLANGTNSITLNDALVGSSDDGQLLAVFGGAGNDTMDASTVTMATNKVSFSAGAGNDILTGGAGADIFNFAALDLTNGDTVNGGTGVSLDRLTFTTAGAVGASGFANVSHIEQIVLTNGANNIALSDALVGSADDSHLLTVIASSGNGSDTIDASAVTTAANKLTINSGGGNDTLTGGAGDDNFIGGAGADLLTGNGGADHFIYTAASESSSTNYDTLAGIDFASDRIDTTHAVSAIDAAVSTGTLSTASFDTDLANAVNGHLNPYDAMLFTANAGGLNGQTYLVVDLNGSAGYQANADLVFHITGQTGTLATSDFV